jgi:translation initiation factor 4G
VRSATASDAPFLAWVMLAASRSHLPRGAWDLYVDGPDARVLALLERMAAQDVPSFCRWQNFLVAEVDGVPAAGLSGYRTNDPGMENPDPAIVAAARDVLGWRSEHLRAADLRLLDFLTCVSVPPPDTWAVEWVATRPEFRRHGLAYDLLRAVLDAGRRRGLMRSQILVLIGNTPARCAYERAGFHFVDEKRHPDFERAMRCPGIARLVREI